jgi:hypothetical protein
MSENPVEPRDVTPQDLMRFCAVRGWDQAVLIYRRSESDGDCEGVTHVGLTYRDGQIAAEMGKVIKQLIGMKVETADIDKEIAAAKREMSTGPNDEGSKIIMPAIDRTRGSHRDREVKAAAAEKRKDKPKTKDKPKIQLQ